MTESSASASQIATAYLDAADPAEAVHRLCTLATSPDPALACEGTQAIFHHIVEPLADSFEPADCRRYERFFSRVLEFCRQLPQGRAIDEQLKACGLGGPEAFLTRAEKLRQVHAVSPERQRRLKKVLVLSRVTLGADVVVTSVILGRMKRLAPEAGISLLGSPKAGSLFASDARIRLVPVEYRRSGTLLERLRTWLALVEIVAAETAGLAAEEYLVLDPDSRLTQLGMLPVTPNEDSYRFFESRCFAHEGMERLGQLTGGWLDEVFGAAAEPSFPYVSLAPADQDRGRRLRQALAGRLAAVNLGVGGNPKKRVADPFEHDLLLALFEAGYKVILDRGAGEEELRRSGELVAALERQGKTALPVDAPGVAASNMASADLITWEGSLSGLAGLISAADLYVGYDSAGGHLATALGVPAISVFAGGSSARMRERWSPWGRVPARIVAVEDGADPRQILRQVREQLA
jgi:ADP-heptose:LPS heptosyltransferase